MEKDGWLDQILLGVLGFLNQPWLAIVVAIGGSFAVAYLARMSPKGEWTYIKEGPGRVLLIAFALLAVLKSAPRLVLPTTKFTCDTAPGPLGIPVSSNCGTVTEGGFRVVYDYTFADVVRDILNSLVLDAVFGAAGFVAGTVVAIIIRRRRRTTTTHVG